MQTENAGTHARSHARTHTHIQWENPQLTSAGQIDWAPLPTRLRVLPSPTGCWGCESSKKYNRGNLISVHSAQQMITVHVAAVDKLCVCVEDISEHFSLHMSHSLYQKLGSFCVMEPSFGLQMFKTELKLWLGLYPISDTFNLPKFHLGIRYYHLIKNDIVRLGGRRQFPATRRLHCNSNIIHTTTKMWWNVQAFTCT